MAPAAIADAVVFLKPEQTGRGQAEAFLPVHMAADFIQALWPSPGHPSKIKGFDQRIRPQEGAGSSTGADKEPEASTSTFDYKTFIAKLADPAIAGTSLYSNATAAALGSAASDPQHEPKFVKGFRKALHGLAEDAPALADELAGTSAALSAGTRKWLQNAFKERRAGNAAWGEAVSYILEPGQETALTACLRHYIAYADRGGSFDLDSAEICELVLACDKSTPTPGDPWPSRERVEAMCRAQGLEFSEKTYQQARSDW